MKVKLALAQINTTLGVVEKNLDKHLARIKEARIGLRGEVNRIGRRQRLFDQIDHLGNPKET